MTQHYDTDDFFKSQLEDVEMKAPMHLFEGVVAKRSFGHKILNQLRLKWQYGLPLLFLLGAGWMATSNTTLDIGSKVMASQEMSAVATPLLVPDVIQKVSPIAKADDQAKLTNNGKSSNGSSTKLLSSKKEHISENISNSAALVKTQEIGDFNKIKNAADLRTLATKASINDYRTASFYQENQSTQPTNNNLFVSNTTAQSNAFSDNSLELAPTKISKNDEDDNNEIITTKSSLLPVLTSLMVKDGGLNHSANLNALSPDQGCVDFSGNRSKRVVWYVEGFVSPDYSIKRLTLRNSEAEEYSDQRQNTESYLFGGSGGIRVGVTGKHLGFKTGVTFNQINEKFELNRQIILDSTTVVTTDTIINGPADTTFITNTSREYDIETTAKTTYNYYRSLEIPILLTYNINRGRRLDLGVTAGALLNVWTHRKGEILSPSNTVVDISGNDIFRKTYGLNLYAGLDLAYHLTNQIDFMIEPQVRYNMQPLTKGDHILIQKYFTAGVNVGFRYRFP